MQLVRNYFVERDISFEEDDGWFLATLDSMDEPAQFGLTNLSQYCSQARDDEWQNVIAGHFDGIVQSLLEQHEFKERLQDWNEARPRIALRLWHEQPFTNLESTVYTIDLPHTVTKPVFDLSFGIRSMTNDDIAHWNKSIEEIFKVGLDNVRAMHDLPDPEVALEREYGTIYAFSGESFFVSSIALFLEDYPEVLGTYGALVGIPTRHALLSYPIDNINVVQAVQEMIPIIMGMERDGPGSISQYLYWFRDGEFILLPVTIDGTNAQFTPPDEFVALLNSLAEDE